MYEATGKQLAHILQDIQETAPAHQPGYRIRIDNTPNRILIAAIWDSNHGHDRIYEARYNASEPELQATTIETLTQLLGTRRGRLATPEDLRVYLAITAALAEDLTEF